MRKTGRGVGPKRSKRRSDKRDRPPPTAAPCPTAGGDEGRRGGGQLWVQIDKKARPPPAAAPHPPAGAATRGGRGG